MWILRLDLFFFKEKQANVGEFGEGGVWYVFIHLWETEMHDLTPPSRPPIRPVWLRFGSHHTLHPFMCIDVKFVHKTQHLLTLFFSYFHHFIISFKLFLFHFLGN